MTVPFFPTCNVGDDLDYELDFIDLLETGDSIATASVSSVPSLTITDPVIVGTAVTFWLSGTALMTSYLVTVHVTTANGDVFNRDAYLNCLPV